MSDEPKRPTCIGCPHKVTHESPIPMKKMGVMMHMGEKFCIGGKKARRFKRSDPSSKEISLCSVPAWRRGLRPLHSFHPPPPHPPRWAPVGAPVGLL